MGIDNLQNIFIIIASGVSLFSIPILLYKLHRIYKLQKQAMVPFHFLEPENVINELKEKHVLIRDKLANEISILTPLTKSAVLKEVDFRLNELKKVKGFYEKVQSHGNSILNSTEKVESKNELALVFSFNNTEVSSKLIKLIDELIENEEDFRSSIEKEKTY